MLKQKYTKGFTLIELSISIAFISVLAITIAIVTVNLINSYQRGMTLKELNTLSTELIDDLRAAVSNSSAKSVSALCESVYSGGSARQNCETDSAYSFIFFANSASVSIAGQSDTINDIPIQGGFCSGTYSYLWNSGYFFNSAEYEVKNTTKISLKYSTNDSTGTAENFHLLKILDPSRAVCIAATTEASSISSANSYSSTHTLADATIDISGFNPLTEIPTDLLPDGNNQNFALYNLYVDKPSQDSQNRNLLYTGSFILATVRGGINITASNNYCATPENYTSDLNYCAINKFNFAARATGE